MKFIVQKPKPGSNTPCQTKLHQTLNCEFVGLDWDFLLAASRNDWREKVRSNVMDFHLQLSRGIPGTCGKLATSSRTESCCFSFIFKVLSRVENQETRRF